MHVFISARDDLDKSAIIRKVLEMDDVQKRRNINERD
jgi:hypothetical protein